MLNYWKPRWRRLDRPWWSLRSIPSDSFLEPWAVSGGWRGGQVSCLLSCLAREFLLQALLVVMKTLVRNYELHTFARKKWPSMILSWLMNPVITTSHPWPSFEDIKALSLCSSRVTSGLRTFRNESETSKSGNETEMRRKVKGDRTTCYSQTKIHDTSFHSSIIYERVSDLWIRRGHKNDDKKGQWAPRSCVSASSSIVRPSS